MSIFAELKRRNVFKVGIAYLVGSWLIIQIADILFESIGTPEWVLQTMFVVLGIGFFVALFFAWAFELTPEGIKREHEVNRSQSITGQTGRKLDFFIIGVLVVIAGYFIWESRFSKEDMESEPFSQADSEQADDAAAGKRDPTEAAVSRQSIAVLPFTNRSRLEEDVFFVDGVHDDLLTNLARIGSLKVISRTSVMRYKDTDTPIPVIARELGVATVMEGAVQRAGNTVRINVQLIDAQTDEHLWAEIFDRELSTDNLFAIQSEISQAIADALKATLSPEEQEQINRKPTDNLAAYNAYLLGRQLLPRRTASTMEQALKEFRRAVELDPDFALAWVGVAEAAMLSNSYGSLSPNESMEIMAPAIDRALEIDPLLGEAYASQGQLHRYSNEPDKAERSYQLAIELSPNYPSAYHWYSLLLTEQPERAQEALRLIERAAELDPMSSIIRSVRAWDYMNFGEYERAEQLYFDLIELDPDFPQAVYGLADMYAGDMGRFDKAAKWNLKARTLESGSMRALGSEHDSLTGVGADELADSVFREMEDLDAGHYFTTVRGMDTNLKKGNLPAAREYAVQLSGGAPWGKFPAGIAFAIDGDYERARELMLAEEPGYADRTEWSRLLETRQDDACLVAWVLMNSGDEELGRDLATQTTAYLEDTLPMHIKHADRFASDNCHAAMGNIEAAIATLEEQVAHNHIAGWWWTRSWPPMSIVLDDPRFIALDQQVNEELDRQRVIVEAIYAEQDAGS